MSTWYKHAEKPTPYLLLKTAWVIIIGDWPGGCLVKAIMLAAGAGTRCCPFAYLAPKLFRQIRVIPLVEYMLSWFSGTLEQISNVNIKTVSRKGGGK